MGVFARIVTEPIDTGALVSAAVSSADGAVATFEGRVRNHHQGREVERLEYHAYPEMAGEELERIGAEIAARFEVDHVALAHRTGNLAVGEVSVAVVVSAPHRHPALAGCAAAIEEIKRRLPIWKKEFFPGHEPQWVFGPDEICPTGDGGTMPGDGSD